MVETFEEHVKSIWDYVNCPPIDNAERIAAAKKTFPNLTDAQIEDAFDMDKIAREICSVQPMNTPEIMGALEALWKASKSEKELTEEGYHPVCEMTRLMWVKNERKDND